MKKTFVGFGFGPIQGGLFLYEAFQSCNFDWLVVAEVMPDVVRALRAAGGRYRVNVATRTGLEVHEVAGVEVLHPVEDRVALVAAVAEAKEIATALPSVDFFDRGEASVAKILTADFAGKREPCVVYSGENHNRAAEILEAKIGKRDNVQLLNTVIGKMSGVAEQGASREFLVEECNRILITKITLPGFHRGITVFEEKPDLLPFEEAKLYGHNATHALPGFLANRQGCRFMSDVDDALRQFAREALVEEAVNALIAKHAGVDPLFTPAAWALVGGDLDDLWPEATEPMRSQLRELIVGAGA
jgi:mannitol-1-phosphate 5-dehydrogenase